MQEEHREELKSLRGKEAEEEGDRWALLARGGQQPLLLLQRHLDRWPHPVLPTSRPCSGPMVINGSSLPESLLEALGMPSGAGFQIKLVRSGAASPRGGLRPAFAISRAHCFPPSSIMNGPWALPAGPGARGIAIDDIEETEEGEEGERRSDATVVSAASMAWAC